MASWEPDGGSLDQLVQVLSDSERGDSEVQQRTYQAMQEFHQYPDYSNYLVYIFTKLLDPERESIRQNAGLQLKNIILSYYAELPREVQQYIQSEIVQCLGDDSEMVRTTTAQIISAIACKGDFSGWPELLPSLVGMLDEDNLCTIDGALQTLHMLCEDCNDAMEREHEALMQLIPRFLHFFKSEHETMRMYALDSVNQFVMHLPAALLANMNDFLEGVFFLALHDSSALVRKHICEAFFHLVAIRATAILPHLSGVINFMLQATLDAENEVALEACEFWGMIAENPECHSTLEPFLPQLLHVLLERMVYSEMDLIELEAEDDDESVPDRPENMPPRFHKSRGVPGDDDDGGGDTNDWNVRKCAAFSLDMLANAFRDNILPHLVPLLSERMADDVPWTQQEGAILALGAIAHGCYLGLQDHLPVLVEYLLRHLQSEHPLMLNVACWSLSQYSRWICEDGNKQRYFEEVLAKFLELMRSRSKRVQEAACSAFAVLEEEAGELLSPFVGPIIETVLYCFEHYQAKNTLILLDSVGTLAESVNKVIAEPMYVDALVPAIMTRWEAIADSDRSLLAVLECLTSVSVALGLQFKPYVQEVFGRCLRLIESNLIMISTKETNDRDFMVCSLDLLSSLMDCMKGGIESLVNESNLLRLVYECMKDVIGDVRQSSFALVGDIAKFCPAHIYNVLEHYVAVLLRAVQPVSTAASNNACWALGEITFAMKDKMNPYADDLVQALIPVLTARQIAPGLLENATITLGRLSGVCPEIVARYLAELCSPWCRALAQVRTQAEKVRAFKGCCATISQNPEAVLPVFGDVCMAIGSWGGDAPPELQQIFYELFQNFRQLKPDEWDGFMASLDPALRQVLAHYGV